jgi:hypothetical protein
VKEHQPVNPLGVERLRVAPREDDVAVLVDADAFGVSLAVFAGYVVAALLPATPYRVGVLGVRELGGDGLGEYGSGGGEPAVAPVVDGVHGYAFP